MKRTDGHQDTGEILGAIQRVLRGDHRAYEAVVRAYQDLIYRICRSYLKNVEEAEDADRFREPRIEVLVTRQPFPLHGEAFADRPE